LKKDLTVFGFNYPPENRYFLEPDEKNNMKKFLHLWNKEVEKILAMDEDTHKCSFDEFLLLFVRQQSNLEWNELLPRYYKEKKNYLLNDVSETIISSRFKPEPPADDPRYKMRLEKRNRQKSETSLETKAQKMKNLEKVILKTEETIQKLEQLSSSTQDQMKKQLQILRTNTTELVKLYIKQREEYIQEKAASPRQKRVNPPKRENTKHSTKEEKKEEHSTVKEKRRERSSTVKEKKKEENPSTTKEEKKEEQSSIKVEKKEEQSSAKEEMKEEQSSTKEEKKEQSTTKEETQDENAKTKEETQQELSKDDE